MDKELHGLVDTGVFSLDKPREWSEVKQEDPNAQIVGGQMLLGRKGEESLDPAMKKYKGRFVALGNALTDAKGRIVHETDLFIDLAAI